MTALWFLGGAALGAVLCYFGIYVYLAKDIRKWW